jgi:alginate O-acetyltransferase complex protein AlgI
VLLGLLAALALAPVYWLIVPAAWRPAVVTAGSLLGLAVYDPRLLALVPAVAVGLALLVQGAAARAEGRGGTLLAALGLMGLTAFFVWNKRAGDGLAVLPSQGGLAFLGVSYLVLKAAAALVDAARGTLPRAGIQPVLAWLAFLPTYPSGPMERFEHFHAQRPAFDPARVTRGLERILVGLVKSLLVADVLGQWASTVFASFAGQPWWLLLLGLYAFTLRFYFDFSGYSDIAIGLAAVFGWDIEENFDWPLVRRNLVLLWQHWHMTLTRFLRDYLFVPVARRLMRRRWGHRSAVAGGQMLAMAFCGLWHGLAWNFLVWGMLQAVGLTWVGVLSRDAGRWLPAWWLRWWRTSRVAAAVSIALTFNFFALSMIFVVTDVRSSLDYLAALLGR